MALTMIRAKLKSENTAQADAAVQKMFAAIHAAKPAGVKYASCKLADGETYVIVLEVEDGKENPLGAIPEVREFQANLKDWIAGPPQQELMTVLGSYQVF